MSSELKIYNFLIVIKVLLFGMSKRRSSSYSWVLPPKKKCMEDVVIKNEPDLSAGSSSGNNLPDRSADLEVTLPDCWNRDQWYDFQTKYPWLFLNAGKLGCSSCQLVQDLGVELSQGVCTSKEWRSGSIAPYGSDRKIRQASLRKKISDHKNSTAHKKVIQILERAEKQHVETTLAETMLLNEKKHKLETTCTIFRTVYYCVQHDKNFKDHPALVELQVCNGADMGQTLHSEASAASITNYIASEMRKKLAKKIVDNDSKLSLLIDECVNISCKGALIIYLRCAIKNESPRTVFLDIVEPGSNTNEALVESITSCLENLGFNSAFLKRNLVGVCSDGSGVLAGIKSGFIPHFSDLYPGIVKWNCLQHRIESSILDNMIGVDHVIEFIDTLHGLYIQSFKNQEELSACNPELESKISAIGRNVDVRWVALSYGTLSAIWESFARLHKYFVEASKDHLRDGDQRVSFQWLAKTLSSETLLTHLAIITDVLEEVTILSEGLKNELVTIQQAYRLIKRTIRALAQMKEKPGKYSFVVEDALNSGKLFDVPIEVQSRQHAQMNHGEFLQTLVDNLSSRLFITRGDFSDKESDLELLVNELDVINPRKWPQDIETPWTEGEQRLVSLCKRLRVDFGEARNGLRDFIDDGGSSVPLALKPLTTAIDSLPISTVACEEGLNTMNAIFKSTYDSFEVSQLSNIMFINLIGPPLKHWDPLPYVKGWLLDHHDEEKDDI